ncbi:MAG: glycosyltransferase [Acidobacteriia bacterium]|nr:glycosyltransferase [Terriglobia bacterium]
MRILKISATYSPFLEFGGPPVKVRALAEGLVRLGHAVTVLTTDWGLPARGGGERSPYGFRRMHHGVESIYLRPRLRYRTTAWTPALPAFLRDGLRDFDVVHIYGLYDLLGPTVAKACRAARLPYVLEPIGMFVPLVRNLWLKRVYHALLGNKMIRGAHAVIATSQQEAGELLAGGIAPGQVVLRRNGVEIPAEFPPRGGLRRKLGIPPAAQVVLFLGRLSTKKSPDLLLHAFARLAPGPPDNRAHLVFAGPDDENWMKRLTSEARLLNISVCVHFAGPLYDEEKWAAYRDADVFVLPSRNENFGNTAAEAAAAGTPVVVTDVCGVAELLAPGAGLVVPHEERAMAVAIQTVLQDAALREKMLAAGAALAARLGWEEPSREMERLYARVAGEISG